MVNGHPVLELPVAAKNRGFNSEKFLVTIGEGREIVAFRSKHTIFSQGDAGDEVFYLQKGKVRLTVLSKSGKEATLGILGTGDFFGEGCLIGPLRVATATAMTDCTVLQVERKAMMRVLHEQHSFSDMFVAYLLHQNIRREEDLVDQLFNSSEKRLADSSSARSLRQGRGCRNHHPQDKSRDTRRDGRHNPSEGELLYE
jgi:CRP/FNR family transcriptional regulator, cyclic AMP receptor protein